MHRVLETVTESGASKGLRVSRVWWELWVARDLVWQLVRRDLLVRARGSFLSMFWNISQPILWLLLFLVLNRSGVLHTESGRIPYALHAYLGVWTWSLFSQMLQKSSASMLEGATLVTKVRFPHEALVLAGCTRAFFDWMCGSVIFALLCVWTATVPALTILALPLALLPLVLLGMGLGFILGVASLVVRDIFYALPFLLPFWMLLSPVMYDLPTHGAWRVAQWANPVVPVLGAVRSAAFGLPWLSAETWGLWCAGAFTVLVLGCLLFRLMTPRLAEYA